MAIWHPRGPEPDRWQRRLGPHGYGSGSLESDCGNYATVRPTRIAV